MVLKLPCNVKITWGKDVLEFKAHQVRVKWDKNSFTIEGILKPDIIKVEPNGPTDKTIDRD